MRRAELLVLAPRIRPIAAAHGATNLAAHRFVEGSGDGSVARDETGPRSDLDRLALEHALEDALHCRVDLIRRRNLRPEALVEAEGAAVPLA